MPCTSLKTIKTVPNGTTPHTREMRMSPLPLHRCQAMLSPALQRTLFTFFSCRLSLPFLFLPQPQLGCSSNKSNFVRPIWDRGFSHVLLSFYGKNEQLESKKDRGRQQKVRRVARGTYDLLLNFIIIQREH